MEDHCHLQKEDIEEVAVDFQKKVLGLSDAEPAGMMEEVSAAGPAPVPQTFS